MEILAYIILISCGLALIAIAIGFFGLISALDRIADSFSRVADSLERTEEPMVQHVLQTPHDPDIDLVNLEETIRGR